MSYSYSAAEITLCLDPNLRSIYFIIHQLNDLGAIYFTFKMK